MRDELIRQKMHCLQTLCPGENRWAATRHGIRLLALLVFVGSLAGCHGSSNTKASRQTVYETKVESLHKSLHFSGVIQPISETSLTAPMEGAIQSMAFHYGQTVDEGAVVFALSSSELQKQYNDILTEYLKAKDGYTMAKSKFVGTEDLWQSGLISKNTYLSEKSSVNASRISLVQATGKLTDMLEKMGDGKSRNLSNLSFSEFDKVRNALTSSHNVIYIKTPSRGVLLYPPKTSEDKSGRLTVGSTVKSGQVLALIGDLRGIRVEIDVPEVDIDKIKPGMKASIHNVAFPRDVLQGELVAINAQASNSNSSSLPSFSAVVEVKQLTPTQQAWVKVGMSAAIELSVDSADKLLVPIAAVQHKQGESIVQVQDAKGSVHARAVITGIAQADKVVIDSGLAPGEKIVYRES